MTLMDKVIEVGYKKDDHLRFFSRTDNGLIELVNDLETWNLVNNVVKPKVVEIWVITGVDGLEETCDADEVGVIGEEETFNEDEVEVSSEDSDWEKRDSANELELFEGSENEIDDQDFVKYVDPNVEYGGVEVEGPRLEVQVPRAVQTVNAENVAVTEDELSHYNSDDGVETHVGVQSVRRIIPELPSPLWIDRTFINKGEFKDAVKVYAIQFGKELKFIKNDKVRCVAKCKQEGCKWQVTCRKDKDDQSWKITTLNDNHEGCSWIRDNKFVTSSFIAKRWKNEVASNSTWSMNEFREKVCTDEHVDITKRQAYKAMAMAVGGPFW